MSRKILVTGGAGFIGCNFVRYWLSRHPEDKICVLDALTYAGKKENLQDVWDHKNFRFVQGDICDQALVEQLLREDKLDTIVHFAAESHVDRSIAGPDVFVQTNIIGTHALLKAARLCWIDERLCPDNHRFHHVSTDEVYGSLGFEDPPFSESTPYAPNSPYSASKAASDHLVRAYHKTFGLKVTTSNCSNNYGPYQAQEKLIPTIISKALYGQPIPVYGDGKNIRDWLHVDDHCAGIELIMEKGEIGETYNVGGGEEKSNIELVKIICSMIDELFDNNPSFVEKFQECPAATGQRTESLIQFVEDRLGHDLRYAIDGKKLAGLGYKPVESDLLTQIRSLIEVYGTSASD